MATAGLAALARLPARRFERDAEARMTAVPAEALSVLEKSVALHLDQYDPARSPAVAEAWLALAHARRALSELRAAEAEAQARRVRTEATASR